MLYFVQQLKIDTLEVENLIEHLYPIQKEDIGEEQEMTEVDTHLIELYMYMMVCYQKSLPELKSVEGQSENVSQCINHPEKKLNFICTNVECPSRLFCMKCRRRHGDCCSRNEMIMTPQIFNDDNFYEEYYQVDKNEIEDRVKGIEEIGEQLKQTFNGYIEVMVKQWKNELLTLSKEPMIKYAQTKLIAKLKAYKGERRRANRRHQIPAKLVGFVLRISEIHFSGRKQRNDELE